MFDSYGYSSKGQDRFSQSTHTSHFGSRHIARQALRRGTFIAPTGLMPCRSVEPQPIGRKLPCKRESHSLTFALPSRKTDATVRLICRQHASYIDYSDTRSSSQQATVHCCPTTRILRPMHGRKESQLGFALTMNIASPPTLF